jgi:hypothetical protein
MLSATEKCRQHAVVYTLAVIFDRQVGDGVFDVHTYVGPGASRMQFGIAQSLALPFSPLNE